MVGGTGGGLPLAAGNENNGSVGCAEQRPGRAVCVGVGQRQPRFLLVFTVVYTVVVIVAVTDQKNTRPGAEHGSAVGAMCFG